MLASLNVHLKPNSAHSSHLPHLHVIVIVFPMQGAPTWGTSSQVGPGELQGNWGTGEGGCARPYRFVWNFGSQSCCAEGVGGEGQVQQRSMRRPMHAQAGRGGREGLHPSSLRSPQGPAYHAMTLAHQPGASEAHEEGYAPQTIKPLKPWHRRHPLPAVGPPLHAGGLQGVL